MDLNRSWWYPGKYWTDIKGSIMHLQQHSAVYRSDKMSTTEGHAAPDRYLLTFANEGGEAHHQFFPVLINRLNRFIRTGAMECEVPLSILQDIPSYPEALLVSKASRRLNTSSSVQKISLGCGDEESTMKR